MAALARAFAALLLFSTPSPQQQGLTARGAAPHPTARVSLPQGKNSTSTKMRNLTSAMQARRCFTLPTLHPPSFRLAPAAPKARPPTRTLRPTVSARRVRQARVQASSTCLANRTQLRLEYVPVLKWALTRPMWPAEAGGSDKDGVRARCGGRGGARRLRAATAVHSSGCGGGAVCSPRRALQP